MADKNVVGGGVPGTPEKKRRQEKETVGLMIELYCRGNHGTPKGQLCPDCAACGTTPMRGWTTARTWRPRRFAASARPIATSPKCGSRSARSCAGAAPGCCSTIPCWRYGIWWRQGNRRRRNKYAQGRGVPCPVLYCREPALLADGARCAPSSGQDPSLANPLDNGTAAVNAAGRACPAPTTL